LSTLPVWVIPAGPDPAVPDSATYMLPNRSNVMPRGAARPLRTGVIDGESSACAGVLPVLMRVPVARAVAVAARAIFLRFRLIMLLTSRSLVKVRLRRSTMRVPEAHRTASRQRAVNHPGQPVWPSAQPC
jgi:hypothetical protein